MVRSAGCGRCDAKRRTGTALTLKGRAGGQRQEQEARGSQARHFVCGRLLQCRSTAMLKAASAGAGGSTDVHRCHRRRCRKRRRRPWPANARPCPGLASRVCLRPIFSPFICSCKRSCRPNLCTMPLQQLCGRAARFELCIRLASLCMLAAANGLWFLCGWLSHP